MLRSILVALDDTPGAVAARDLALALARRTGAALTAATVLDRPHAQDAHEAVPRGGSAFKERRDAALLRRATEEAGAALAACRAAAGDLPFTALTLEDAPEPALLAAGAEHDVIVIGRDSTLGREQTEDGLAPVIEALLKDGARPLLVVPPGWEAATEGSVVVAYDGSVPAMRALQLFALLSLHEGAPVTVLSVADAGPEAEAIAARGTAYLARHGIAARALGVAGSSPMAALTAEAQRSGARLLVAGAFGRTGLRSLFFGSATPHLLHEAPCPLFIHH